MNKSKRKPARRFLVGKLNRCLQLIVWGKYTLPTWHGDRYDPTGFNGLMTRKEAEMLSDERYVSEATIYELVPVTP